MIERIIQKDIERDFFLGKAVVVLGARQVGKTTLIDSITKSRIDDCIFFNGDEADTHVIFSNPTAVKIRNFIGDKKIVIIDEAQRINDIGIVVKLMVDQIKDIQVIVSGSSSLELANKINEPLTGRVFEYELFPISLGEMVNHCDLLEETRNLHHRLVYGYYPEVVNSLGKEKRLLSNISGSYLYKDLLTYEKIKKPKVLDKLVRALSLQIGSEVSYNELSQIVGIDKETVEKYIDLLEKAFVVFKVDAFSRNVRNEIKKSKKIYFYDNGIRNAVIGNFTQVDLRNDIGALWENFFVSERKKYNAYRGFYGSTYFWRTKQQQEIDLVEEVDGKLTAIEIKWNQNKKVKFPKTFLEAYDVDKTIIVTPDNYYEYLR